MMRAGKVGVSSSKFLVCFEVLSLTNWCIYIYMCVCNYISYIYIYIYIYTQIYMHGCMYVRMYIFSELRV